MSIAKSYFAPPAPVITNGIDSAWHCYTMRGTKVYDITVIRSDDSAKALKCYAGYVSHAKWFPDEAHGVIADEAFFVERIRA